MTCVVLIHTVMGMNITHHISRIRLGVTALAIASLTLVAAPAAQAEAKPGCGDIKSIQEFSKALSSLNPVGDPKTQSATLKKSSERLKTLTKTAPQELKSDYEFMAKLMGDLSVSFAKIDQAHPETIAKALEPLSKGAARLALLGPHLSAYATKNCK